MRDVTYRFLDTWQNWRCLIENRFSRLMWLRAYLGGALNYLTLKSTSNIAKLKHTLIHKCLSFSASRLFHHFIMSARSGSTRYLITLSNKVSSDCKSYYIDGLMHSIYSVSAERLNLSQVKDSATQMNTIHYDIAEKNPVLKHWWGVFAILLLRWSIRRPNTQH